jgi:hypothetical protein
LSQQTSNEPGTHSLSARSLSRVSMKQKPYAAKALHGAAATARKAQARNPSQTVIHAEGRCAVGRSACAACAGCRSETIASAIGCARGGGRCGIAANSSVSTGNIGSSTGSTAGPTYRVRSIARVVIRSRYGCCGSARPPITAWRRSVNAGCANYSNSVCACWKRINSKKQT